MSAQQRIAIAGCLGLTLLVVACRASDEHTWTYRLSRAAYDGDSPTGGVGAVRSTQGGDSGLFVLAFLAPFIIDTIILPVTLTHDIVVDD